jgi:hypothetical protein
VKITATNHDAISAMVTTQKMPPAYSPTAELANPIGRNDERARKHRESGRGPRKRGSAWTIPALLDFDDHHLDRDDRVIHQQAESDDQGPEADAVQVDPEHAHHDKGDREHERHRERHDDAGAPAERDEADRKDNGQGLHKGALELSTRVVDHRGWSATWSISTPCGTAAMNSAVAALTSLPKARIFAPFAMTTPTPSVGLPRWRTT